LIKNKTLINMKKQILLSLLTAFTFILNAQNVNIPDANFKAYLVGNSAINTNGDTEIQVSEAAAYTGMILCNSMNIADLTGLEEFVNITGLHACCNQITNVDVSMMPNLTQIWISVNQLTSANVANGNNTNFDLYWFDTNPNLHCIQVDDASYSHANWASSINPHQSFSENCSSCTVFIPDANFKAHLVGNPAINTNGDSEIQCSEAEAFTGMIGCSFLGISSLTGIEAFTNITGLICADNQLTSLDVSANTSITVLECFNNQLTSLNLSSNTALVELACFYNEITNLDLSNNSALRAVSCQYNQLTSLNLANGNNTNFTYIAASNNPSLTCVKVDNVAYSTTNWTEANEFYFDATASFSENCSSTTSINSNSFLQSIQLYPNPANDIVTLVGLPIGSTVSVSDVAGRIYKTLQVNAETVNIHINDFANGVYILNINSNGSNAIKKLIKSK
jgi:hypothetical protein